MRIGLVSKWTASGQAVFARQIRSALDDLGHETFVLARPGSGPRAKRAAQIDPSERDAVWDQPGITEGSTHEIPTAEYERWAEDNDLELILFDENYQWDAVGTLRAQGIRTVGRFVWEYFADEHVEPAKRAYDTIYALTAAERDRYAEMGIDSPYVQWGIHPELLTPPNQQPDALAERQHRAGRAERTRSGASARSDLAGPITFYFPGSFLGRRKPIRKVIRAFGKAQGDHLRLLINAQVPRNDEALREAAETDRRIELMLDDEPEAIHRARFAACDVCLAPSRWEGLGLPLYEATAFGLPIITNDRPPMSEMVIDGTSGILVPSVQNGTARSGIPAWDPEVGALTAAIERLGDREELGRMRAGVKQLQAQRDWSRTVADLKSLIAS